jgi:hypothetical protein
MTTSLILSLLLAALIFPLSLVARRAEAGRYIWLPLALLGILFILAAVVETPFPHLLFAVVALGMAIRYWKRHRDRAEASM